MSDLTGNPLAGFALPFDALRGDVDRNGRVGAFGTRGVKAKQGGNTSQVPALPPAAINLSGARAIRSSTSGAGLVGLLERDQVPA